jgi:alpha-glucosidase
VVVLAEAGKSIVVARRSGEKWYLVAMNGDAAASFKVPLKFLGRKKWTLRSFADDPKFSDYQTVLESTSSVNARTVLTLTLAPAGGFAGIISRAD